MSQFDHQWQKLVGIARQAPDARDTGVPYGFAARVVAQSAGTYGVAPWAALERFAMRGFLAASACCVAAVAFNYFGRSIESSAETQIEETLNTMLELS
jgi:hypothetical protein